MSETFQGLFSYNGMDAGSIDSTLLFHNVTITKSFLTLKEGSEFEQCRFDFAEREFVFETYLSPDEGLDEDGCVKVAERITITQKDLARCTEEV